MTTDTPIRHTSSSFAQDMRSLQRLQRHDRRVAALRVLLGHLAFRILCVAVAPPILAATLGLIQTAPRR